MSDNPFALSNIQTANDQPQRDENPFSLSSIARDQGQDLRTELQRAVRTNPDQAAEVDRLAKQYPAPKDVLLRNLQDVQLQAAVDAADEKLRTSPKLADYMRTSPWVAKQSHDDVDALTQIAQFFSDTGGSVKAGVYNASKGAAGVFRAGAELIAPPLDVLENVTAIGGNPLRRLAEGFAMLAEQNAASAKAVAPKTTGNLDSGFQSGVQSLTQNLLTLPLAFAPGGQAAALAGMVSFTGGQSYQDAREKGLPMSQALPFAASQAAIEYATEKLPLGALIKDVKAGTPFFETLAKQIAMEVPGEQLATLMQDLNEWAVLNPDKPFTSYLDERPSAAAQTLVATIVGAGGNVAVMKGIEKALTIGTDNAAKIADAERVNAGLQDAMKAAAASKLRERNPETFKQLVQHLAEENDGQAPTSVFIDAALLQGVNVAEVLPSAAEQMADALATNGSVEVSISDVLTAAPGTPLEQVFLQNARATPDGISMAEAEQAFKQADQWKAEADRVMAEAQDQAAWQASADNVKANLLGQLNTAGRFTPEVNEAYSTMVRDFYATMARRLGITPEEMFAKYPLRIAARGMGGQQLDQREPGTWFHGTTSDVEKFNRVGGGNMWGPGYYLTDNPDTASGYALGTAGNRIAPEGNAGPNVMPVRVAEGDLFEMASPLTPATLKRVEKALGQKLKDYTWPGMKNRDLRQTLTEQFTDQAGANALLQKAGFKGLVESSATAGPGRTLMVFDAKDISSDITGETLAQSAPFNGTEQATTPIGDATEVEVDGKMRPALNSNGQPIHWSVEGVRNFWRWFGDSRVVDADGRPLVVYHGTRAQFTEFDYGRIGQQGRAEGAGFYFTTNREVASGYGEPMEVYLAIQKPMAYDAKGFNASVLQKIVKQAAELEAKAEGTEPGDGFLSNFGDVYSDGLQSVVREAAKLIASDETAIDQLSGIVGSGVSPEYVNAATISVTGFDGVTANGFSNVGGDVENRIFVALTPTQIKSATGNSGAFSGQDANILRQNARGTYSPDQLLITLNANADLSTFLHESGHFFLEVMADLASQPNAPADVQDDMNRLLKWFGIRGNEQVGGPDAGGELAQFAGQNASSADVVALRSAQQRVAAGEDAENVRRDTGWFTGADGKWRFEISDDRAHFVKTPKLKEYLSKKFTKGAKLSKADKAALEAARAEFEVANDAMFAIADRKSPEFDAAFEKRADAQAKMYTLEKRSRGDFTKLGDILVHDTLFAAYPELREIGISLSVDPAMQNTAEGTFDTRQNRIVLSAKTEQALLENLFHEIQHAIQMREGYARGGSPESDGGLAAYRRLAGEVEARNTASRATLTPDQRRDTAPSSTADVPADAVTVVFAQDGSLPTDNTQPAGRTPLEVWNAMTLDQKRQYHERFAESFEQYLLEGKAPSQELQPLFRKFRAWLVNVYKSLTQFMRGRDLKLSDEVRQVFDRMLAAEDAIKQQEEASGLLPDFDATNEAIEKLQARSLRDLKWTVNARNRALKALQKEAAYLRKAVEDEVRAEVEARPEVKAKRALDELRKSTPEYKAALAEWNAQRQGVIDAAAEEIKTSLLATEGAGLKGIQKGQFLAKNKRRIANEAEARALEWERSHKKPERTVVGGELEIAAAADATGFESTEAMLKAIDDFGDIKAAIEGMTDQRMLENFGELATPEAIEEAANDAVHNEARAKSLATELKAQADMLNTREQTGTASNGRTITVNTLTRAAKEFGANLAARRKISDLKRAAQQHRAAEAKAGRAWQEATAKGQTQEAVAAKRDQVLNNAAVKALNEAQAEAKKIVEFFRKVTKDSNEKLVDKGRDPDVVNAMRAILAAYDVAPRLEKSATEYMELVARNDPGMYGALKPAVDAAMANAKPLSEMTMEELRGLNDELRSMWHLAKRSRQMEIDGNLLDRQELEAQLTARMGEIGIPDTIPGERGSITAMEEAGIKLQFAKAILSRVEQWAERLDGQYGGPFLRYIFQPVKAAADRYRAARTEYRKKFTALVDNIAPLMPPGAIAAPELGYTFGNAKDSGMAELLHAILHTGNDSNKRKLLLGRQWATENPDGTMDTSRWDAFITRMINEGKLTKAHYDFAQGVWDLLEEAKPLAQKAHREVFGRYFAEVTANAFDTPFGSYRGGYVPAQTDSRIVTEAKLRELAEAENESMAYAFPAAPNGFTKARVEYNKPLLLDLRTLPQHLDKVLLFSHMQPTINDVRRLLTAKSVSYGLDRIDPGAYEGMLTPWLKRSAQQVVETPVVGDRKLSRFLAAARSRAGMALMFANLSNTVQQITGFSLAAVKVKPSLMMSALGQFVASPKQTRESVAAASIFMRDRMENEVAALNNVVEEILVNPSLYERSQAWTQRHAYFLQSAVDNTMAPIIWTAAYNQAIEQKMDHGEAVKYADGVIRQTQGSTLPEDVSRFETGPAMVRVFTQFVGYFNMMANTNATAVSQIVNDMGLRKGAGKLLYVALAGLFVPIWVAEAIAVAFKGGPDDEDHDGYLDDWLAAVFGIGTFKGLVAQVPIVGQAAQMIVNQFNTNPADDKFSLSPAVSLIESAVRAPKSVYDAIVNDGKAQKAVRDVATLATMLTGLPFYAAARPLGYAAGVAANDIEPADGVDMARGLVTGVATKESKR